jgi:uncharacterized PurR-regulated membrane protein YhhQ (DUF165 family)
MGSMFSGTFIDNEIFTNAGFYVPVPEWPTSGTFEYKFDDFVYKTNELTINCPPEIRRIDMVNLLKPTEI